MKVDHNKELSLSDIEAILGGESIVASESALEIVDESHQFLIEFSKDKVIYGINTGLGPMAQYKVADGKQIDLQYNLIRSHSAGAGNKLPNVFVKAAMISRLRAIIQGISGIHPSSVTLLAELINRDIYPFIPEHGGVGASGDLVQLSHLALVLIGEGKVTYKGELVPTKEVFEKEGLKPISVVLREGLSLINGTSVMTGIGLVNVIKAKNILKWSLITSSLMNEIAESFDDHFSAELNDAKKHTGQKYIAQVLRHILSDSAYITKREQHFYVKNVEDKIFKKKVQEYYSLRCLPQILGPVYETISNAEKVVTEELNSVSDNPIIDAKNKSVYHGGNFHGDYISLEMDKLKLAVTRLSMLSERQLNFILNPKLNEKLPPFVNLGTLGLNLGVQGMQFTATSTVAENQTLSNSMYVHSIPNNNDNQDIVSMGTNSALLTAKVIDNTYQVLSVHLIALLQAVDYLEMADNLCTTTKDIYNKLRKIVPVFIEDTPKYEEIENIKNFIEKTKLDLPDTF